MICGVNRDRQGEDGDLGTRYRGTAAERRALDAFIKLLRAAHWVSLQAGKRREAAGLTESQFGVLEALYHLGPRMQTEIAEKMLSSPSNLTLVIDNLERDGLVKRRRSEEDRRCQVVHLTERGRRLIAGLFPLHAEGIVELMGALSPREQETLGRLCRKLGLAAAGPGRSGEGS